MQKKTMMILVLNKKKKMQLFLQEMQLLEMPFSQVF